MSYAPVILTPEKHSYSVSGQILMAEYGVPKYTPFAMVETADLTIEQETQELPDSYTGQGNYDKLYSVKSVSLDLKVTTFQPEIIAEMTMGVANKRAELAITDEVQTAYQGVLVPLENLGAGDFVVAPNAGGQPFIAVRTTSRPLPASSRWPVAASRTAPRSRSATRHCRPMWSSGWPAPRKSAA
jgi:hypothetical protein